MSALARELIVDDQEDRSPEEVLAWALRR